MSAITFDTYKFVERLEKAGISREHAAAIAEAQRESMAETLGSGIATRGDVAEAKSELKADIAALRSEIQAMEYRLIIKLGSLIALSIGIVVALVKLL